MATPERTTNPAVDASAGSEQHESASKRKRSVGEKLIDEGYRFEFFQAVRLLERMFPERKPVGDFSDPEHETVRFRAHISTAFPPSQIHELRGPASGPVKNPVEMEVNFMGLAGPLGVLPIHYTEMLADPRMRKKTLALRDFLDMFNHRMVSLFYRAWEKYHFPISYERGQGDTFSQFLYCLIGMGTGGLLGRLGIHDNTLLYYAGLLAQRPRSAVALEGILQDYFDVPVEIVQFAGEWFLMNEEALTKLGAPGQNSRLGVNAVLWAKVWDPQARFRIRLGPLTYEEFRGFLPVGEAYRELVELARFYVGEEFNFELQLILKAEEVPWCSLAGDTGTRLGWSMWLKEQEFQQDPCQPVLELRVAHRS